MKYLKRDVWFGKVIFYNWWVVSSLILTVIIILALSDVFILFIVFLLTWYEFGNPQLYIFISFLWQLICLSSVWMFAVRKINEKFHLSFFPAM